MNKRTLYKRMLVGALALAVVATAVYGVVHRPGTARAASTSYEICLDNPPGGFTRCLELANNVFSAGNPIVLDSFHATNPPEKELWGRSLVGTVNSGTFSYQQFDTTYNGRPIYYLEKKTATGHDGCIGVVNSLDLLGWETCGSFGTQWVYSGNEYFISVGKTNQGTGQVLWLMSLQQNPPGATPHCQSNIGNSVAVAPQGSGECNFNWGFAPV